MKLIAALVVLFFFFFIFPQKLLAIEDPLSVTNNKIGVHILFPSELKEAAILVNSNGGDWGYVTIPIQAGEKDIVKWQKFMNEARTYHIIPLIRLATEGDYFNTVVWRKPKDEDIVDFANFLSSLDWPTQNKYVIIFNEVNRADEWGGGPNASEYAQILDFAVFVFKQRSSDFFIISSGLDNASATIDGQSVNPFTFLRQMNQAVPGVFDRIDGLASHSYPNPAFSKPPDRLDRESIATYRFEKNLLYSFGRKKIPIFVTETGWSRASVSDDTASSYFTYAFEHVWNDEDLVTITPFLLKAGPGQFGNFSLVDVGGNPNKKYQAVLDLHKVIGTPKLTTPSQVQIPTLEENLVIKDFGELKNDKDFESVTISVPDNVRTML